METVTLSLLPLAEPLLDPPEDELERAVARE